MGLLRWPCYYCCLLGALQKLLQRRRAAEAAEVVANFSQQLPTEPLLFISRLLRRAAQKLLYTANSKGSSSRSRSDSSRGSSKRGAEGGCSSSRERGGSSSGSEASCTSSGSRGGRGRGFPSCTAREKGCSSNSSGSRSSRSRSSRSNRVRSRSEEEDEVPGNVSGPETCCSSLRIVTAMKQSLAFRVAPAGLVKTEFAAVVERQHSSNEVTAAAAEHLLWAHHFQVLLLCMQQQQLLAIAARTAVALLRRVAEDRPEVMFYSAGTLCQNAGLLSLSLFCFNKFLDVVEAIQDGGAAPADDEDTDLAVDIPSLREMKLPRKSFISAAKAEAVREWVLDCSVNKKISRSGHKRVCSGCSSEIYEALLTCPRCGSSSEACMLTGYPVNGEELQRCCSCSSAANKAHWLAFVQVYHTCPWCASPQQP